MPSTRVTDRAKPGSRAAGSRKRKPATTPRRRRRPATRQSTMTIKRKKAAYTLVGAFNAWGERAATSLEKRLAPMLEEGETMPDLRLLFRLMGRLVKRADHELDEADAERWMGGMHLMTLRDHCREAKAEVYSAVCEVRKCLVELFGSKRSRFHFHLKERTPRGAEDLAEEARGLLARLSDPHLKLPAPRLPGLTADPAGWVAKLEAPHKRLSEILAELEVRRIGTSDRVLDKERHLKAFDQTHLVVARGFEALLALAGEKELARRLRPKGRKKVRPATTRERLKGALEQAKAAAAAFFRWLRTLLRQLTPQERRRRRNSRISREIPLARSCLTSPPSRASAVTGW